MALNIFGRRPTRAEEKCVAEFEQRLRLNRLNGSRRYTRGNIAIQMGKVLMPEQLERERESLRLQMATGS